MLRKRKLFSCRTWFGSLTCFAAFLDFNFPGTPRKIWKLWNDLSDTTVKEPKGKQELAELSLVGYFILTSLADLLHLCNYTEEHAKKVCRFLGGNCVIVSCLLRWNFLLHIFSRVLWSRIKLTLIRHLQGTHPPEFCCSTTPSTYTVSNMGKLMQALIFGWDVLRWPCAASKFSW